MRKELQAAHHAGHRAADRSRRGIGRRWGAAGGRHELGESYPARTQAEHTIIKTDPSRVKRLEAPGIPVHANDVTEVSYSLLRAPGCALYYAMQDIFTFNSPAAAIAGVP